ncbi:MAG TPA: BON domain-containing protein [Longimicrobiaceae bacterium]|nr:BON domain-containing protein [Longimicrobiaceae bacterium]
MRVFQEPNHSDIRDDALTLAVGAIGGLALGMLLSRKTRAPERLGDLGHDLKDRARNAARRFRPARLRRRAGEQRELTRLEDAVLDAFLSDPVLGERGIDVGAISPGIIELSGSVVTDQEAAHAVHVANGVVGVSTVVNRMELESELQRLERTRGRFEDGSPSLHEWAWQGQGVGMGKRRQSLETDPDRPDDSQEQKMEALREADLDQWQDEGFAAREPQLSDRGGVQDPYRTDYDEEELDNQDPHGKHARYTLDSPPQDLNTDARVGEGLKPGTELQMEEADIEGKPHSEGH